MLPQSSPMPRAVATAEAAPAAAECQAAFAACTQTTRPRRSGAARRAPLGEHAFNVGAPPAGLETSACAAVQLPITTSPAPAAAPPMPLAAVSNFVALRLAAEGGEEGSADGSSTLRLSARSRAPRLAAAAWAASPGQRHGGGGGSDADGGVAEDSAFESSATCRRASRNYYLSSPSPPIAGALTGSRWRCASIARMCTRPSHPIARMCTQPA